MIWDAATGNQVIDAGSCDTISCMANNGKKFMRKIWNAISWQDKRLVHSLKGHTGWGKSVAFSPDGKMLVVGDGDGRVCIFDVVSGKQAMSELQGMQVSWVGVPVYIAQWCL